nr:hypothetical protein [Tanacetum cinerariifolium]
MDTTINQQVAIDEALVPHARRLGIGRSNFRLLSDISSKEFTLQLVYDVLRLTPFFKAFLFTADVLEIYMQEFWATATVHHHSIRFKMDNKKHIVNLESFREMLHICPRLPGQAFVEPPFEEEIIAFLPMTEAQQLKLATKRSLHETHISQASGSGTDEGTVALLPVSAPTLTPFTIATITTTQQAPTPPITAPSTFLQDLPDFGSLLRNEAQKENDEFLKTIDENMQKIIKEQVKEQVKIILDTYEDTVTLKRCRDDDADKDEEPSAGSDRGSKRRREGKEPDESATAEETMQTTFEMEEPLHPEFEIGADDQPIEEHSQHPEWFSQQKKPPTPDYDWNKTLPATHRSIQPWISALAKQSDSRSFFNELMDTPVDFSNFLMNWLKVDTLAPELLAGPTYELMKGSCKSLVELEFFLEEVYKATTDQLDWVNPEGQQYPHNLLKPLPLIPNSRGHHVIPFDHFINNDLKYLCGGASSRKYTTSVTKTKAADYEHIKLLLVASLSCCASVIATSERADRLLALEVLAGCLPLAEVDSLVPAAAVEGVTVVSELLLVFWTLALGLVWRNRNDLDTMSLDDLYNHLKVYEAEVQKKSNPNSYNMAFISSSKHSSGDEDGNTACVPTASAIVPTASASVATISQDTVSAYIASQSSGSQIKFEDINQIDEDNMEEMDIKWSMALLSMKADKF